MAYVTTLENITDPRKGEILMYNTLLFKLLGLNQILNPESIKLGGYNVFHTIFVSLIFYEILVSLITCVNGLLNWTEHRNEAILHFGIAVCCLFSCYKMSIPIRRSREIRDCLSITRFHFTSLGRFRGAHRLLEWWRNRIFLITYAYTATCVFTNILFMSSPLVFRHGFTTIKSLDGSMAEYRINVINLYAMFSAETYNAHFNTLYLFEASGLYLFLLFYVVFDTLLITLCLAFSCQLQVINVAFESSGPTRVIGDPIQSNKDNKDSEIKSNYTFYSPYEHSLTYNELKTIIKDHQSIMKKFEKFFSVFQRVALSQIIVFAFAVIAILLNLATKFIDGEINEDSRVTIIKMVLACPIATFQLFMSCYLFEFLQNQKESTGFTLYSTNWTEMDMKCRKLILMTMRMNNAHKRKLKFSQLRIVNAQMFFSTMHKCYSILSVILKRKTN